MIMTVNQQLFLTSVIHNRVSEESILRIFSDFNVKYPVGTLIKVISGGDRACYYNGSIGFIVDNSTDYPAIRTGDDIKWRLCEGYEIEEITF